MGGLNIQPSHGMLNILTWSYANMNKLSVLVNKDPRSTEEVLLDDMFKSTDLMDSLEDLVYDIEYSCRQVTNLYWLKDNIDTLRHDVSFQDILGIQLRRENITSSEEVLGGISKAMSAAAEKITAFFKKIMQWFQLVFMVTSKNAIQLLQNLQDELSKREKLDKLKKEYTTKGIAVSTFVKYFAIVLKDADTYKNALTKLNSIKSNKEDVQLQEIENNATQNKNQEKEDAKKSIKEGNGEDEAKETGVDPDNGGWFSPDQIKQLENNIRETNRLIGIMKDINGVSQAIINDIKGNTNMTKEVATSKINTLKAVIKETQDDIKDIDTVIRTIAKKAQVMLNVLS